MMLKISCPCGHVGLADASILPRELTCSLCGSSRHVHAKDCTRIRNRVAVMERILGEARLIDTAGGG
jgi:hypothetical protein